jgi:hypothetical protein
MRNRKQEIAIILSKYKKKMGTRGRTSFEAKSTFNPMSPRLEGARALALQHKTFNEFSTAWQQNFHGVYWHITDKPDFKIDPTQRPRDMSSGSSDDYDYTGGQGGFMVSTDMENWSGTLGSKRAYAVEIDLSDLKHNVDYRSVARGFGHEIYIDKPEKIKVKRVLPLKDALRISKNDYKNAFPQSESQLKQVWDAAHKKTSKRAAHKKTSKRT